MTAWSPSQYLQFADERTRAARDLLAAVPLGEAGRVVDIGCGPGNSSELLAKRFPGADLVGLDASAEMLAAARKRLPAATFVRADVVDWRPPAPVDLMFANAVLQWVPDHVAVLARLMDGLADGGALAVQMPDNLGEPCQTLMGTAAEEAGLAARLAGAESRREQIAPPAVYYDRLKSKAAFVDIWRTVYHHSLAGPAAIVEWFRSTGLRPYLDHLDAAEQEAYLARYQALVAEAYPPRSDGRVLLAFPRLFIVAIKASVRDEPREANRADDRL